MQDAFGVERSEVSKAISPNQLKALSNIAGTEGAAAKYAQGRLAANTAGREAAKSRPPAFAVNSSGQATRVGNGRPSAVGRVQRESSRRALSNVAREPRAGSVASAETAAAEAIRNNRTRSQKVLQAVGSGSRAVGTRVRAAGSRVGSGTARAGRAMGSGTARASRAVRASMTRTPRAAAPTTAAAPTVAAAPAAATGTEAGTATVKNKSRFKRNAALVGGGALAGAGGMAYNTDRNNQMMSKSAFGVDHEVSKATLMRLGSPMKAVGAFKTGATRAKTAGMGVVGQSARGLSGAVKSSPITAGLATTGVVGAGAAGAYGMNRKNQTMSKSAFGVDHEVSKGMSSLRNV